MGVVNTKRESRTKAERHENWMAGSGFSLSDPIHVLRVAATSCFFGEPMYYQAEGGKPIVRKPVARPDSRCEPLERIVPDWHGSSPAEIIEGAIDKALDADPEKTLAFAAELRDVHHIRTTPQVLLVRAAHHARVRGTDLIRRYAPEIVTRADEPAVGLAYHLARYGKNAPIPNALKRAWARALAGFSEYELAKYQMRDREVKTVDVIALAHPKSAAVDKLCKGALKVKDTWEAIISAEGSTQESWTKALATMGHMALLRNLRNLVQAGVPHELFLSKLVAGAPTGKQLPFRYFSAHKALANAEIDVAGSITDAVESCMTASLGNLPKFPGRAMFLCDNSGSAWGTTTSSLGKMHIAEIANLSGIIGGQLADEGYVGVFGDDLEIFAVRKRASVFDQFDKAVELGRGVGASTENGIWLFWHQAISERQHWDNVFVFSDMQAGHGGLYGKNPAAYREFACSDHRCIDVPKLVNAYRAKVNPNVNVYLIQVAGYPDTIMPEFYKRTYILGGWGEGLFKFAAAMSKIVPTQ